ncbi:MAG: methylated-DNA--[protein]-cysteine S-methyltransferase [Gallionella sp.]|jgi:methylated-DNA-[protein]-cysteine S-methyltransferase
MFQKTGASAPVFYLRYHRDMDYQAKLATPFALLGIRCDQDALLGIDFLPPGDAPQPPASVLARAVCDQLLNYIENPDAVFSIPLKYNATPHRQKVWQAMLNIPRGCTRSYGELAAELHSCAQAVGQACGANPIPIIIPCHRVTGKAGLGGFMKHAEGAPLDIKRWLLAHERITPSPPAPLPKGARGEGRT